MAERAYGAIDRFKLIAGGGTPLRAWAEIRLDAIEHNANELRRAVPPGTELIAVVKADAYGHGALPVARRLVRAGVRRFAVAHIDEAIALRRAGIRADIVVLGFTPASRLAEAVRRRIALTVVSAEDAERLQAFGRPLRVHMKIDTGMHRLGERYDDIDRVLSMYRHDRLIVEGTYSHLATADSADPEGIAFARLQIERFHSVVDRIRAAGLPTGSLHLQGSYGMLNYPELRLDAARPGIALYGLLSAEDDRIVADVRLRPALSLKTVVAHVHRVRAGETVGYGRRYVAATDRTLATLSIGYADGVPRELSQRGGCVLVRGKRAPLVGVVCMDQLVADVTDVGSEVQPGDVATLIGADGENVLTAGQLARLTGTITNDIVSGIGSRVTRVYV